ncbi:MAG: polyprenyl synthetase [Acidobacteria bacterium]|nr:MAG: polyprenyl synthetase [Acidobacteriota bacterium]
MTSLETIQAYLEEQRARVEEELERLLPPAGEYPPSIHRAMRYSIFAGGKRLRPILCLESGKLFGGDERNLRRLGCALEMIHTYSLIHDDLPALDDDDLRRGMPTSHRQFGEATAILAGDALLTLAFETLAAPQSSQDEDRHPSASPGADAQGSDRGSGAEDSHLRGGMVAGQVVDLESTGRETDAATLQFIHSAKTGAFIRAAVRSGAIAANAPEADVERMTVYGEKIGLAFQIADDLLDVLGSRQALGKAVGKDGNQQKATYPALHGVEQSQRIAAGLVREACEILEPYGSRALRLQEIAHFLLARRS